MAFFILMNLLLKISIDKTFCFFNVFLKIRQYYSSWLGGSAVLIFFFDFGFFDVKAVDTTRGVDVDGEFAFAVFGFFEGVFEDNWETNDDEEGGDDDFPGDVPTKDVLRGEEEDDAESEQEEVGEFFVALSKEADEARDDDEECPPAVEEQFKVEQVKGFAAEVDAKSQDCNPPDDWFDAFHKVIIP